MDGVTLADTLLRPTDAQVAAQDGLAPNLTLVQDAIYRRSMTDIREAKEAKKRTEP